MDHYTGGRGETLELSRTMKRIITLPSLLVLATCASFPVGGGKEPAVILIRNRSGEDIETVLLREPGTLSQGSQFGSISPVPKDVSQEFVRPTNAPPMPRRISIEWLDHEGRTHACDLSLSKILRSATGSKDEALVFEIGPFDDVLVFMEHRAN
jgi:hypothetical protein